MDLSDTTRVLLNRITEIEPEIASKAIGYLLLKDYGDRDMIRLAYGPDAAIWALLEEVKSALPLIKLQPRSAAAAAAVPATAAAVESGVPNQQQQHFRLHHHPPAALSLSPPAFQAQSPFWDAAEGAVHPVQYTPRSTLDPPAAANLYGTSNNGHHLLNLEELSAYHGDYPVVDATVLGPRTTRRPSFSYVPESPPPSSNKACHYYYKGYCKHGVNCRYLHDQSLLDGGGAGGYAALSGDAVAANDDHEFVPGSLEKLEAEITELLRSSRGQPVTIAMLPLMYHDRYGKILQADGYLTESQRHGKAGYNLTKLLARMRSSIRLIDRPHGQHSVVLAEDAPRGFDYRSDRSDPGSLVSGSQQIYLTFPAESTFTEDDIASYFSQFGPVQAVRIPAQQKRMFGFVTFVHPETVQQVFAKGNPHYICEARVLVKPYREKTRKSCDKIEIPIYYHPPYVDLSPEFQPVPKVLDARILRKQLEQEQLLEVQRHMTQLRLASQPYSLLPWGSYNVESMAYQQDPNQIPYTQGFGCRINDVRNESVDEDKCTNTNDISSDKASQIDLPESPFASL